MNPNLRAVATHIEKATVPEDIFGDLTGTPVEKKRALLATYRHMVVVLHPDKYKVAAEIAVATPAFEKIIDLRRKGEDKIDAGTYGDRKIAAPAPSPDADPPPTIVATPRRQYVVSKRLGQGDICDVYLCTYVEKGDDREAAFKIAQHPGDNDLVENEAKILAHLVPKSAKDEKFFKYLPKVLDTFSLRGKSGSQRKVNVMPRIGDEWYTLVEVRKAHPNLDFKDAVWMFNRILEGIGYAHRQGVVHGALVPTNVFIHPVDHGAKIIDWCYAVQGSGKIPAVSVDHKAFYPPEVFAKTNPSPATDIYMAARLFVYLTGGDVTTGRMPDTVPKPLQGFIASCFLAQSRRPDDAWTLHDELTELLSKVVGPRVYRPLTMPAHV